MLMMINLAGGQCVKFNFCSCALNPPPLPTHTHTHTLVHEPVNEGILLTWISVMWTKLISTETLNWYHDIVLLKVDLYIMWICDSPFGTWTLLDWLLSSFQFHCCFMSTETIGLLGVRSPGWLPRLSWSSWALDFHCLCLFRLYLPLSTALDYSWSRLTHCLSPDKKNG